MGANLDYYAVRDEFMALSDKAKALEQTYNCLNDEMKTRVVGEKEWKSPQLSKKTKTANILPIPAHIGPFDSKEKNTASIQGNYLQADLPSIGYHASSTDLHNQNNGYKMDLDDIQIAASTEIQANLKHEEEVQS